MFKKYIILLQLFLISIANGQNELDALRYSLLSNENTAGISALGGAGGLWSHNYNPASLAFFGGNNLFSISLGNKSDYIEARYLNELHIDENPMHLTPFIQNLGYVTSLQFTENTESWSKLNIAISVNRKQNFNQNFTITAYNPESSISNQYIANSQNIYPDDLNWNEWLAFDTYLINPIYDNQGIFTGDYSGINILGQNQTKHISESGFINEVDIAFASTYQDILFLGGSIGFTHSKFSHRSSYIEEQFSEENNILSLEQNEYLFQQGGGVNIKFGAIIKPLHFLRIGLSYHSPTYHEISEFYENALETNFEEAPELDANFINSQSYSSNYDFTITTPAKSIASLALIGKYKKLRSLLTFDIERINYGSAKLSTIDYYDFYTENQNIAEYYGGTHNMKMGIYLGVENISLRGGYAVFGSPFKSPESNNWSQEHISCGLGYKFGAYSLDVAITQRMHTEDYILYNDFNLSEPSQTAEINSNKNTVIITGSYKF